MLSLEGPARGLSSPCAEAVLERGTENLGVLTDGLFQELRMEIAKQELIVQAREAASRVLRALSGACGSGHPPWLWGCLRRHLTTPHPHLHTDRQTSERMASDARKREQFQRLKEQFVQDQEVGGAAAGVGACGAACGASCGGARGRGPVGSGSDPPGRVWCLVQRRRAARQEALDDDVGPAPELCDRERRLRALEEQLERKAR